MAVALSAFFPFILPYAVGCPQPLARRAVLDTCIDFSRRALVLEEIDKQDAKAGVMDYDLAVPAACDIVKVKDVMYNGRPLRPLSKEEVRYGPVLLGEATGDAQVAQGAPQQFFQRELGEPVVSVNPVPNIDLAGGLVVRFWYAPAATAKVVPEQLFDLYRFVIADGALERILRVAGQPFTNPAEADRRGVLYSAGVRNAGVTARTGQVAAASRVRLHKFPV